MVFVLEELMKGGFDEERGGEGFGEGVVGRVDELLGVEGGDILFGEGWERRIRGILVVHWRRAKKKEEQ